MSEAARWVWAKSKPDPAAGSWAWSPLWRHLDDSGGVAGRVWDSWLPAQTRAVIAEPFGGDETAARRLAVFLAAVHDVGKATPAFAVQVPTLADEMRARGLPMPGDLPLSERRLLPHGLAGHAITVRWLERRLGWTQWQAHPLAVVVGGHHGVPPTYDGAHDALLAARRHLLGDGAWTGVQEELLDWAARRSHVDAHLAAWSDLTIPQPVQALLTGLVIVADWLASNAFLFPLVPVGTQPVEDACRLDRAWRLVGIPSAWHARDDGSDPDELLRARFTLPPAAGARPVQRAAVQAARSMDLPGLLVLEAPMGEGKTEAALLAAEILAARSGAAGAYVALPTQATSDAMFGRVVSWLAHVPDAVVAGDAAARAGRHSVELAHSKAYLNPVLRQLHVSGGPVATSMDDPTLAAAPDGARQVLIDSYLNWWMQERKRGQLADFVVGTIDQLLFVALQARHLALRHLAMARKVVIIDEAHAYDAYMNVYLRRALEWLGAYHVPVIVLSATLPVDLRDGLVNAYRSGVSASGGDQASTQMLPWQRYRTRQTTDRAAAARPVVYPAVTSTYDGVPATQRLDSSGRGLTVHLEWLPDDEEAILRLLDDALVQGGCALVVRNTVGRAVSTAATLRARFGEQAVVLDHSRFLAHDRARIEEQLRQQFGPPDAHPPGRRPRLRIVVATQVIEQSLDVDFDLLVTDVAPIDLTLQRIGRLHRHRRGAGESDRPGPLRQARCLLTGVAGLDGPGPPDLDRGSVAVYGAHTLLRSTALLAGIVDAGGLLTLPDDIAVLVHRGYSDDPLGPEAWREAMGRAAVEHAQLRERKESEAAAFRVRGPQPDATLLGWLTGGVGEAAESPQGRAQVRDTEETVEALLLQRDRRGQLRVPDWVGPDNHAGELLPMDTPPAEELAVAAAGCSVRLPRQFGPGRRGDALITALEELYLPAWQQRPELRGQLILPLDDDGATVIAGHRFTYDPLCGLEVSVA